MMYRVTIQQTVARKYVVSASDPRQAKQLGLAALYHSHNSGNWIYEAIGYTARVKRATASEIQSHRDATR